MKKLCIGLFTLLLCSVNFDSNINFDFSTRNQETEICQELICERKDNDCDLPVPQISSKNDSNYDFRDSDYSVFSSFSMKTFFDNLREYSPHNNIGSCGYVSLIQAMSYYDTFVDDKIIDDAYERHCLTATDWEAAAAISPGVLRDSYSASGEPTYYDYCHNASGDLQSALTIAYNKSAGTDNKGTHVKDGKIVDNYQYSIGAWDYQDLFNEFYSNESPITVSILKDALQSEYINYITSAIDSGNPVIVHIQKIKENGESYDHHSVVAYDYDATGIYANFGWNDNPARQLLLGGLHKYDEIYYCAVLNVAENMHVHSNNYVINGEGFCGCNLSEKVYVKHGGDYINVPPTLHWMKNPMDPDETYRIRLRGSNSPDDLAAFTTEFNCVTLSVNAWKEIIGSYASSYYVYLTRVPSSLFLLQYAEKITNIATPNINASAQHITIAPAEYQIINTYVWNEETKVITQGSYSVTTKRKRVGYVENQNINLSANRSGAGEAFIEYEFEHFIGRIDIELSFWSKNEGFYDDMNKSTACIQYQNGNGNWLNSCDLLADADVSTNRFDMDRFTFIFPEKTKKFRVISTFEKPKVNSNLGRICIGDLSVYFAR